MSYQQYNQNPYAQGPQAESGYDYDSQQVRRSLSCFRLQREGSR